MPKHIEGQCPVCLRKFTPRRVRMETMIYCSQKCCNFTSLHPDSVTAQSADRDAILAREWEAIVWAREQMVQKDKEEGLLAPAANMGLIATPDRRDAAIRLAGDSRQEFDGTRLAVS